MVNFRDFPERITVTSALPYVNGVKHLGNIVGSLLPADIFHRYLDLFEVPNIYICGTDDHGTAVEIAAEAEGLTPKDYAKKYYEIQRAIYNKWNFDFTSFGHTSSESNHEITQELFLAAYNNGYVLQKVLVIPYCHHCNRFLPDRFIAGTCPVCEYKEAKGDQCEKCGRVLDPTDLREPRCAVCGRSEIEFRNEKHLFLDFGALQGRLRKWIEQNDQWPDNTRNFALGWLNEGLKPRCITRNLKWGVKVPLEGYDHLVFYVWFDAPIGYISITKDGVNNWREWWTKSRVYHFLGKDNVPFHTIFWPGTLIASGKYVLPYYVAGYEYLNWQGEKFSTSRGIGLFSDEALDLFPSDYWRFYLASILPETKDSNFDWNDFQQRVNAELIGNYGNLFYRATHFIKQNFDGRVPAGEMGEAEKKLQWELKRTIEKVADHVHDVRLKEALRETLAFASLVNKYFQDNKPWDSPRDRCATTLYVTINLLNQISLLLVPFIPKGANRAVKCLGDNRQLTDKMTVQPGQEIRAEMLFRKIEDIQIMKAKKHRTRYIRRDVTEKGIGIKTEHTTDKLELINDMLPFGEFQKVDLRVATILSVDDHPKADKLYVLSIDLGDEERQLVAGLREKYRKEELIGRQIIVVTNLEPKELRGVMSRGMLLAAEDGTLLEPTSKVPNGSRIM